jgi:Integrase core domain
MSTSLEGSIIAFPWDGAPGYMIRDRDRIYGTIVTRRLRAMGIRDKPIAPASPWQNGFAERLIGSIRRECLDHVIVLGGGTSAPDSKIIRRLLQLRQNASIIGQRCAGFSPGSADRKHQIVPHPRRTSSSLRQSLGFRYTQRHRCRRLRIPQKITASVGPQFWWFWRFNWLYFSL